MPHTPSIPTFAVVGQPNQGKSTLLSTLTENDKIKVNPIPGTTRIAKEYSVKVNREKVMSFWDTPGFENTAKTHQWFEGLDRDVPNPAAEFIATFRGDPEFKAECEIFKPLADGAAVIFIVDSSTRVRTADKQQINILRLCGNPRIAVIYSKDGDFKHVEDWRRVLTRDFNSRHEFNAHMATYRDRMELLQSIRTIIPEWRVPMDSTIEALRRDRKRRESECARMICELLKSLVETEVAMTLQPDEDRKEVGERAQMKLKSKIRKVENDFRAQIRKLFRHSDEHWMMDPLMNMDLFSEEVWEVFGMSKKQFTAASAITGAIIGGGIDAMVGGLSFGLGTAIGGAVGAAAGYFGAEQVANITYPSVRVLGIEFGGGKVGGAQIKAKTSPNSKVVGILLDRCLLYAEQAGCRAHGRRDDDLTPVVEDSSKAQLVSQWTKDERAELATYVGHLAKETPKREDLNDSREAFEKALKTKLEILLS